MTEYGWTAVREAAQTAKAIAYDGCHKIYFAMDDREVEMFRTYGYGEEATNLVLASKKNGPDQLAYFAQRWYDNSCGLKFIQAVRTNEEDPNKGFIDLIPQGWDGA